MSIWIEALDILGKLLKDAPMKRFFKSKRRKDKTPSTIEAGEDDSTESHKNTSSSIQVTDEAGHPGPLENGVTGSHHDPRGAREKVSRPESSRLPQSYGWFDAVKANDIKTVTQMLDAGFPVNSQDSEGWSALHLCAWNNFLSLCDVLLRHATPSRDRHTCNVNVRGPGGSTPVSLAAQCGHTDLVNKLLDAGSDLTITADLLDSARVTPLHLAAQHGHLDVTKLLIGHNRATVNATMSVRGIESVTALHLAVQNNHLDVMDLLIEAGCDIDSTTTGGEPAVNSDIVVESSC